ncbi:methyl-accepting chemotaxis protein [Proteinivorax hydrogeniformans]|uniref:Methyl-accepting chemotaxis protein n=1 Tax=Proteinivorax hydrogeniformans TaxID=1826727 RepID=A0AAU8HUN3_9FIRM
MRGLKGKITATFLVVSLLLLSGVGMILYITATSMANDLSENLNTEIIDSYSQNIESLLERKISEAYVISQNQDIKEMEPEKSSPFLMNVLQNTDFSTLSLVFPDGQAYDADLQTYDFSSSEYMSAIFEEGEDYYITNPFPSSMDGRMLVVIAHGIDNEQGERVGAISGSIYLSDLTMLLEDISVSGAGFGWLLGEDGTILAHPDGDMVGQKLGAGDYYSDITVGDINQTRSGLLDVEIGGERTVLLNSPISNTQGWNLMLEIHWGQLLAGMDTFRNVSILILILAVLLSTVAATWIAFTISNPIMAVANNLKKLAQYDLTQIEDKKLLKCAKRKDEIGDMVNAGNQMQKNMISLIQKISQASEELASSSQQLTSTSKDSSKASDEVARAIEEIANSTSEQAAETTDGATAINELGSYITTDQEYLKHLNEGVESVDKYQQRGQHSMEGLLATTKENREVTSSFKGVVIDTKKSTEEIENASSMIQDIAEQTSLLALNAAIEAARAGESGKGFAVVADEIRKLSEQSNQFTLDIAKIIEGLSIKVDNAVNDMEKIDQITAKQEEQALQTKEGFDDIQKYLEEMKEDIKNLNHSGGQMLKKRDEILTLIERISAIAQQNAASTEEISASVEEQTAAMAEISTASYTLSELADEMTTAVRQFKLDSSNQQESDLKEQSNNSQENNS